jgi:hypothetical protein
MITANQIQQKLGSYLISEISFADLHRWIVDGFWDVDHDGTSDEAVSLLDSIQNHVVDYLDGFIDEAGLKQAIRPYSEQRTVKVRFVAAPIALSQEQTPSSSGLIQQLLGTAH